MAERDLSFESLVETLGWKLNAIATTQRGPLNAALKAIREQEPDLDDEDLAILIRLRADDYRKVYPGMPLTPTALSKHWSSIAEEMRRARGEREQQAASPADKQPEICPRCRGDKIVAVYSRPSPNVLSSFDECAPCPDCNPTVISWWSQDGRHHHTPDPDEVMRMIEHG